MGAETALSVLRAGERTSLPAAIVISGPHVFLREYVFDTVRRRLLSPSVQYRGFQVGGAGGFDALLAELREPDLFAPVRVIGCRVLRSHRGGAVEDDGEDDAASPAAARSGEAALADALEAMRPPGSLVVIYERESAPAQIRRAADRCGLVISCPRPFDNQLPQFAEAFARAVGLRLGRGVADLLVSRHIGDLAAIANTLAKAAVDCAPGATLSSTDLSGPAAARVPDLFDLAEALAGGRASSALAILERAVAAGRDPLELLSVEIVPVMRRMMAAASMGEQRRSPTQIASALGLAPTSPMALRAIEGARRLGVARLRQAYRRVSELDAQFKNGRIKERDEALAAMLLDLLGLPGQA